MKSHSVLTTKTPGKGVFLWYVVCVCVCVLSELVINFNTLSIGPKLLC